ncbi:hypothetical protein [Pararhizobium sp. DWP1-1-3]
MNAAAFFVLLVAGFGTSFLVPDISRTTARPWPMGEGTMADR